MRPAVAVGVFPGTVFAVGQPWLSGECSTGCEKRSGGRENGSSWAPVSFWGQQGFKAAPRRGYTPPVQHDVEGEEGRMDRPWQVEHRRGDEGTEAAGRRQTACRTGRPEEAAMAAVFPITPRLPGAAGEQHGHLLRMTPGSWEGRGVADPARRTGSPRNIRRSHEHRCLPDRAGEAGERVTQTAEGDIPRASPVTVTRAPPSLSDSGPATTQG